jgi:hypothetical protein
MFDYSSDSLQEYASSFSDIPTKPTPIVFEKIADSDYAFYSMVPTIPNQIQQESIQKGELPSLSTRMPVPALFGETRTQTQNSDTDPESPKLPFITNLYIASITVVGLFLLFRMIQK